MTDHYAGPMYADWGMARWYDQQDAAEALESTIEHTQDQLMRIPAFAAEAIAEHGRTIALRLLAGDEAGAVAALRQAVQHHAQAVIARVLSTGKDGEHDALERIVALYECEEAIDQRAAGMVAREAPPAVIRQAA